jgi:hypothetical protein
MTAVGRAVPPARSTQVQVLKSKSKSKAAPQVFQKWAYDHARRLRLEKTIINTPTFFSRSWIQVAVLLLKPPRGGFRSKAAVALPFRKLEMWGG